MTAAVAVASSVDRLGFAFAVGYPAALEHLVDQVELPAALCVTEAKGNAPRAIEAQLEPDGAGYRLGGTKTFVTFGSRAKTLIVVARVGTKPDGRPDLAVVRIASNRVGVHLEHLPPIPFVPEIPHTSVRFENVRVHEHERLPGDGYIEYVKPFRTIEDVHVVGSALGYLVGLAKRCDASPIVIAKMAASLSALDGLLEHGPLDPRVHVTLHGVYTGVTELLASDEFARLLGAAPAEERERWERDKRLLAVASEARQARFDAAIQSIR